jgi:hypothetical protein
MIGGVWEPDGGRGTLRRPGGSAAPTDCSTEVPRLELAFIRVNPCTHDGTDAHALIRHHASTGTARPLSSASPDEVP